MFRIVAGSILIILTMLFVPSVEKALFYLPLLFAVSVSVINYDQLHVNRYLGIFLSILQSYLVFLGLAVVMYFFDDWFTAINQAESSEFEGIALISIGGYLAALLLGYFYTFLFKIKTLKFSFWIVTSCYAVVIAMMLLFSKNEYLQFGVEKFPTYLISWCIFMSMAFSICIHKTTVQRLLKNFRTH